MAGKREYAEKLKDPRWQQLRLKVFERDEWLCTRCGDPGKTLHVHHLVYFWGREPWEYTPDHLTTLCSDCHDEETPARTQAMDYLKEAIAARGYNSEEITAVAKLILALYHRKDCASCATDEVLRAMAWLFNDSVNADRLVWAYFHMAGDKARISIDAAKAQ